MSVTDPAGGVTSYTYDGSGRLASEKDAIGRVTAYAYDNAGRLITKTLPNGGSFTYTYDGGGHQTAVTYAFGHATSYVYDADGRLVSTTDQAGVTQDLHNKWADTRANAEAKPHPLTLAVKATLDPEPGPRCSEVLP